MIIIFARMSAALALVMVSYGQHPPSSPFKTDLRTFEVTGVIKERKTDGYTMLIQHAAISNYMGAMTMPFRAKTTNELAGLQNGDVVTFRLSVEEDRSWIDRVKKIGHSNTVASISTLKPPVEIPKQINVLRGLSAFTFTNEFGQAVNFRRYEGQAIGLTFFFTRCPLPEYCPRLSKNFASATKKLEALPHGPTNWHFFSISFDTRTDTPELLRRYANLYNYDSNRWTFLTASPETIQTVTHNFGFNYKWEGGTFAHQFITLVIDANGFTRAAWPIGGDTSDHLVSEIVEGAAARVGH